jgi:6-phosphogluconolactonase
MVMRKTETISAAGQSSRNRRVFHWGIGLLLAWVAGAGLQAVGAEVQWVYVGTYTRGTGSEGIYICRLDTATGQLEQIGGAGGVENPSFLAIHPTGAFLYAVGETAEFRGRTGGAVAAFAIDRATGQLALLNEQSSEGGGPCHLVVDATGKTVLVANYGGGSVASLPLEDNGRLRPAASKIQHAGSSVNPQRQQGPHAHSINLDPQNQFAFAADLGLDQVLVYRLDPDQGTLAAHAPPFAEVKPGSGPRHFAFHPSGQYAYLINELTCTMTAFSYGADRGKLTEIQTVTTLPVPLQAGFSTAEVQVHPSGRFVYGSNRGHDSIAIFAVDQETGKLTVVGHEPTRGNTPRNFGIDPTGQFLLAANQSSGTIVPFRIDQDTGKLTATGQVLEIPAPVCVKFLAAPSR